MFSPSVVRQPRRVLKYSAATLVIALLAYAVFLVGQSWQEAKSDQSAQLATIADLSEVAVDSYFSQLEIGMRSLGDELVGTDQKLDLARAFKLVSRFQSLHTELGNVMLIRGDGQILLTGQVTHNPNFPTLAADPTFVQFRDELLQGPAFAIGQPVLGHVEHSWVSAARYAVTDETGRLRYIVSANLPGDLLQRYWLDSGSSLVTALGLVRDDGYLVSRYPEPDLAARNEIYGWPTDDAMVVYLRDNNHPQQGQVEMPDNKGKVQYLRALRRLQHYPITLFVEMPMSEVKAAWWEDMHAPYFVMALLLASMLGIYILALNRRKVWSKAERREALRREYEEALAERSHNEIFLFDADTLKISYANDVAMQNTGYSDAQLQQMTLLSLHPEIGIESFGKMIGTLRGGEQKSISYETNQERADRSLYPVEVDLQQISPSEGDSLMAVVNDLTALRLAEKNLRLFNAPVERRKTSRK